MFLHFILTIIETKKNLLYRHTNILKVFHNAIVKLYIKPKYDYKKYTIKLHNNKVELRLREKPGG